MIVSVHQPNYIPYLGFFNKIKQSDIFVIYDTAQYSKNDFHNRNRVKGQNGPIWLTIPVSVKLGQEIGEVKIADSKFREKHLKTIESCYKKSTNFSYLFGKIKDCFDFQTDNLCEFNTFFLSAIFSELGIKVKVVKTSELGLDHALKSTDALLKIVELSGADTYLSGPGAKSYLEENKFIENNKKLIWQDFSPPVYEQLWGEFLPYMSVLDMMFNVRKEDWSKYV